MQSVIIRIETACILIAGRGRAGGGLLHDTMMHGRRRELAMSGVGLARSNYMPVQYTSGTALDGRDQVFDGFLYSLRCWQTPGHQNIDHTTFVVHRARAAKQSLLLRNA